MPEAPAPAVGIDIGGTKMLAVSLHPDGTPAATARAQTPRKRPEVVRAILDLVHSLAAGAAPSALGVGIPGLVDGAGSMRFSPHLPGLVGEPLAAHLAAHLPGTALWVGNDATAAGWAEHRIGAAAGADHVVLVFLGTGIGGGIISAGRLNEGANRFAGEFGHMVVDPHGPPCPCGKQGCWERYASGSGLGQLGREAALGDRAPGLLALAGGDPEAVRGEHVTRAAAGGDPDALDIMRRFAWWLGLGLANLANIFDPEAFVLGGGLVEAGEVLLAPVRAAFSGLVEAGEQRQVRILPAALGERAGAIGAAHLALAARR